MNRQNRDGIAISEDCCGGRAEAQTRDDSRCATLHQPVGQDLSTLIVPTSL